MQAMTLLQEQRDLWCTFLRRFQDESRKESRTIPGRHEWRRYLIGIYSHSFIDLYFILVGMYDTPDYLDQPFDQKIETLVKRDNSVQDKLLEGIRNDEITAEVFERKTYEHSEKFNAVVNTLYKNVYSLFITTWREDYDRKEHTKTKNDKDTRDKHTKTRSWEKHSSKIRENPNKKK